MSSNHVPVYEFGLDAFGEVAVDSARAPLSSAETVRLLVEEAVLAERSGLDFYNIGEHYKDDQVDTASHVILGAIAGRTSRIRLGTSVLVLSTRDPVRVFHDFSTLNAVSNGRAELVVGRASQTESFPLFGFDLSDYDKLFAEKLDLFVKLLNESVITWEGETRSRLDAVRLMPELETPLTTWLGIGGNPQSVIRAASYGLPLMIAIIGGAHKRFLPLIDLYERALSQQGQPRLPVGIHSLGLIAKTDDEAMDRYGPRWLHVFSSMAEKRGYPAPRPGQFESEVAEGSLFVGSPETVARKLAKVMKELRVSRFDLKYDLMHMPVEHRADTIRLLGEEVVPRVRELLAADGDRALQGDRA
jgi:probable LLM family oxidoreductase